MVNVGGRSKGCSTCRRRRVKCDETRPICLRCQRQNLQCDGPRELTFIESNVGRSKGKQRATTPSASQSAPEVTAGPSSSTSTTLIPISAPAAPLIGDPLEYYILFARTHLAPNGPMDLALQEVSRTNFTPSNSQLPTSSSSSLQPINYHTTHLETVLSFAQIFFGQKHNSPSILTRGFESHGLTLRRLNTALSQPDCWKYDELIVSVTTLAVQETLIPTGPGHYMNHMLGLDRLLALRNPLQEEYRGRRSVELYKCLRHLILFASLQAGRRSILAREDWKRVLRESCGDEEERMEDEAYRVLADCSGVVVDVEELNGRDGDEVVEKSRELRVRTVNMGRQLEVWRRAWDGNLRNAWVERFPVLEVRDTSPESRPSTVYSDMLFSNPMSPLILLLYNTARLYICKILFSLGPNADQRLAIEAAQRTALLELCRGVPDHSNGTVEDAQLHAGPVVHWAVQMACVLLGSDESDEGMAMKAMLMRKCGWIVEFGIKMNQ